MELEQFIEEDIRAFLDRRQAEQAASAQRAPTPPLKDGVLTPEELTIYAPGRDYARELDAALAEQDVAKAKRVLQALKESYEHYPADAPERSEQRRLLESLYARFQGAVLRLQAQAGADGELASAAAPKAAGQPPATASSVLAPFAAARAPPPAAQAPLPARQQGPPGLSEQQERSLLADLEQAETLLQEREYPAAMHKYRDIRERLSPELLSAGQRDAILPRLHALYERISSRSAAPAAPPRQGAALRFAGHAKAAALAADAADLAEAMRQYRAMREVYGVLPQEEQGPAREALLALYERLRGLYAPGAEPAAAAATAAKQAGPAGTARTTPPGAGAAQRRGSGLLEQEERRLIGTP